MYESYEFSEMIPTLISHNCPTTISFLPPTDFQSKQKENKKNNKILPATSACCGAVTRNECRDHFSLVYKGSSLK
jgi:hypothetical protein